MQPATPTRQELQNLWGDRVKEARRHYQEAKQRFRIVLAESKDMPSLDGSFAVRQAREKEALALRAYRRVLAIFNDLIFYGKRPPKS